MSSSEQVQAKLVILGDQGTGKSLLIHNLALLSPENTTSIDPNSISSNSSSSSSNNISKSPLVNIEFTKHELGSKHNIQNVILKTWEYPASGNVSAQEQELSFRCTLFTIITIDLRNPTTATSAFTKWYTMKEEHMDGSFLIIVGTHMDCTLQRRIDVLDISKACAQKDALYVEISNLDQFNIGLLRRLIAQQLSLMLQIREKIATDIATNTQDFYNSTRETSSDEAKSISDKSYSKTVKDTISTPLLEPDILCSSTGTILSSVLNIKSWPGLDSLENTQEYALSDHEMLSSIESLKSVSAGVLKYIDYLSSESSQDAEKYLLHPPDIETYPSPQQISLEEQGQSQVQEEQDDGEIDRINDVNEILKIFDMIGYSTTSQHYLDGINKLSQNDQNSEHGLLLSSSSLLLSSSSSSLSLSHSHGKAKKGRKLKSDRKSSNSSSGVIRNSAMKVFRENSTVEDSITQNSNSNSSQPMITSFASSPDIFPSENPQDRTETHIPSMTSSSSTTTIATTNKYLSTKKIKVRIQLPDDLVLLSSNSKVDVKINMGDNVMDIVSNLSDTYHFTSELRAKILLQLESACCTS